MNTNNNNGGNAGSSGNRDNNTNRDKNDASKSDMSSSQDSQSKTAQPNNIAQGRTDSQAGQGKLDEKSQSNPKVDPSTETGQKDAK